MLRILIIAPLDKAVEPTAPTVDPEAPAAPVVETDAAPAAETKEEAKPVRNILTRPTPSTYPYCQAEAEAKKEERPKSPSLLSKLLALGKTKGEKKAKAPKSPKKEKKKEEAEVSLCSASFSTSLILLTKYHHLGRCSCP